uniref:Tetratricopeptide repeat protein n=1 Tax=viral metagenome TaxID=1070528 RepID=A0A6C0H4M6_9ZZZZ
MEEEFNLIKETRLIKKIKSENSVNSKYELAKYYGLFETHYEKGIKILTDLVYNIDLNRNWSDYFDDIWKKYGYENQSERIYRFRNCIICLGLIYYNYGLKENAIICWRYGIKKLGDRFDSDKIKEYVARYYLINNEIDKMEEFLLNEINNNTSSIAKILLGKYYLESASDIDKGKSLLSNMSMFNPDISECLGIYYYKSEQYSVALTYLKRLESPVIPGNRKNWRGFLYLGEYYNNIEYDYRNAHKYYLKALDYLISQRDYDINLLYLPDKKFSYDEEFIKDNISRLNTLANDCVKKINYQIHYPLVK